MRNKLYIKLH